MHTLNFSEVQENHSTFVINLKLYRFFFNILIEVYILKQSKSKKRLKYQY